MRRIIKAGVGMCFGVALVLMSGCASSDAKPAAQHRSSNGTTSPRTQTVATASPATAPSGKRLHVHFTNEGPLPSFATPICKGPHCVFAGTETGDWHGDLEGVHITAAGSVGLTGSSRMKSVRADVFNGTVKGCGRGTFVTLGTEDLNGLSGTGEATIVAGFGTGALAKLTGHITGTGGADNGRIHSTYDGDFICGS